MIYSILELATLTEGGSVSETFKRSLDLAQKAEEWGYNRFWFAEHHNMKAVVSSATSVLIGYVAGGTERIRVGAGGIMLPNHAPLVVAEQFGTLGTLYPERIDLGLGRAPGTDQLTASALHRSKFAAYQFPQQVEELLGYFSSERKNDPVRAVPREGINLPVWILGSSTDSAHLAAKLGLPYAFASHFAPAQLEAAIAIYRNQFVPSEYLSKPYVLACINAIAADTQHEAEWLSSSLFLLFRNIVSGKSDYMKPPVDNIDHLLDDIEKISIEQMLSYTFIGDKEQLTQRIGNFAKRTKADELMFTSYIFDHHKRLRSNQIIAEIVRDL
ncbi:MAG: LLM class flavin-dependent oxidoreductase [Capnocytophaga sp.]|nr:LLM class flavin-dependent oxidoreductase [Capnocytophaga sp.]